MDDPEAAPWPFDDADQHDPLAALRIPVTGAYPHHGYLAAYAGQAEPLLHWPRPDGAEAAALASYIGYLRGKYPVHARRRIALVPLLDHVETHGGTTEAPEWTAWKSEHPDIFGELTGKAEAANG